MTPREFAVFVGAVAFAIGVAFLALPHSLTGSSGPINCGSGFTGLSDDAAAAELRDGFGSPLIRTRANDFHYVEDCKGEIDTAQLVGWPLFALGGLVTIGAIIVRKDRAESPA